MRIRFLLLMFAALGCLLLSAPLMPTAEEKKNVPEVKLVKPPDKPVGPHASQAGVQELFKISKIDDDGKLDEADEAYAKYFEKYKDQPIVLYHHAALKLKKDDYNGAIALIGKADGVGPG